MLRLIIILPNIYIPQTIILHHQLASINKYNMLIQNKMYARKNVPKHYAKNKNNRRTSTISIYIENIT